MSLEVKAPNTASIIERVKNILLKPAAEWDRIDGETTSVKDLFMSYGIWLAAIGPVCNLIGSIVFGHCLWFACYRPPILSAIVGAIVSYLLGLVGVFIFGLVIEALAPSFDAKKDRVQAMKVAIYGATAAWCAGVFYLIPQLGVLAIVGLYSLYLLFVGLPKLMKAPAEKGTTYTIVAIICAIVVQVIVLAIPSMILGGAMLGGAMGGGSLTGANGAGSFTFHGKNGSASVNMGQLANIANSAAASANGNGGSKVTPVAGDVLAGMLPGSVDGMTRGATSSASGSAMGMATGNAKASYSSGDSTINLEVTDSGSLSALTGMAGALGVNAQEQNGTRTSKTTTTDGQVSTEEYDTATKSGSYSVMVAGRFMVEANGTNVSMDQLKSAVHAVPLNQLASMKNH
ncbi:MAG TPA: Yip1 family protein [Caulobacteraceae bacterium]|jgi:hypothetical protein|nr:Yip1 family protein [Caulobacteraceae bacterium]